MAWHLVKHGEKFYVLPGCEGQKGLLYPTEVTPLSLLAFAYVG